MCQKPSGSDATQIPLPLSPTDSQKLAENSETENKDESKYEDLQPAQKQPAEPRRSERIHQQMKQWAYIEEIPENFYGEVLENDFCSVAFEIDEDRLPVHSEESSVQNS
jgi:hypothetical protein